MLYVILYAPEIHIPFKPKTMQEDQYKFEKETSLFP